MCGITGFFSYENRTDAKAYYDAHLKISHRGPDDEGFLYKNAAGEIEYLIGDDTIGELRTREHIKNKAPSSLILGHRRLSIIDLSSAGHQPMTFERLSLVYNGEIYNYLELRSELQQHGYTFQTATDTEVFLKAYHCWGTDAFNRFNGMWAAAIYDHDEKRIVLTRDRFGIKPLYYTTRDDSLVFGSEIKFVASFMDGLHVNPEAVYDYLRFNYIDHGSDTFFREIKQLEPNSYMVYSKEGVCIEKYWDLSTNNGVSIEEIEKSLNSAVSLRLRSDVEVGSLLSGGIDSSTILGIIDHHGLAETLQTFSAVFEEEAFSEKKYIDAFQAKHVRLKKHFIYPKAENLASSLDELLYTQEEPFRSLSVYSQYLIYRHIHETSSVKVLLNGQGADEIFTGYTNDYYVYMLELLRSLKLKTFVREFSAFKQNRKISSVSLAKQLLFGALRYIGTRKDKYGIFLHKREARPRKRKFKNLLTQSLWNSLTVSALREYLRYEDRNSMRFSLESRLPFLDFNVVNNAFSLKDGDKISDGVSKIALRRIAQDKIPEDTLNRKDKMGFVSPQELWQKTVLKEELDAAFEEIGRSGLFRFLDHGKIVDIYRQYQLKKLDDWAFVWRVYCLYKWKKVWGVDE